MNNDQILAVSVEARINKLEREMKKASGIVGKSFDGMESRSKRAATDIEKHFSGLGSRMGGIGKNMAAGFVGGLAAGGIMGILGRGGELARGIAEIGDEAKRAGLSIETFQELKYVAEQNRIGVDSLVDGIKELNLRADEFIGTGGGSAAEAFARLGYSAEALRTKLRDPSALFTEIIGKLGQLDRAAQIRIADEIFGGNGGEKFVQLIEQGEDAIYATRQEAHGLGLIMSDELVAKADELDRRFNAVANTVGSALKQAIVGATLALVDFLNTFNQLPAMVHLRASTAPLDTRDMSIIRRQLADKQAALDGVLERETKGELSGWFNTGIGHDDAKDSLAAEIAELSAAIEKRSDPSQFDVASVFEGLKTPTYGSVEEMQAALNPPPLQIVVDGANPIEPLPRVGGGGGRSASAMREERDAAAELIAELEEELRVIGMSEVEKRVDAELRRVGAYATDAQKASIRDLVMTIEAETAAMDRMQAAMDNAKGLAKDFLGGLLGDLRSGVDGATALANAFGRLADRLLDMALDQLINSLFSNLMGGAGGIDFLGGFFGFSEGGVVEAATGGLIRGPGSGTSDSIPARLSDGEFVVNASATRRNLDVLHAINRGEIAAFASGGLVGKPQSLNAASNNANNDNASPVITIHAPITVEGSSGTPEQNADLAKRMARQLEATMRGVVANEMRLAMRPGNIANTRSR
ncbi:phage tail tape measure protein [Devosia sp. 919]|uniref:phage tail tape measure protein n=1 Tax=Devosia sp. 919 TaxID=2726065 RepID=UPI001552C414|nr:phage tail tape measure protein [Devosia sp. 919]